MRRTIWTGALAALTVAGCGGRGAAVPELSGSAAEVILLAAFEDTAVAARPLLLDSVAFGRLGTLVADTPYSAAELTARIRRPVEPVHPTDVLECPSRRPCRLRRDGVYVTLWDATLDPTGNLLTATVSRVGNEQRLYMMTRHTTWTLELRRTETGWRLIRRTPV